MKSIPDVQTEKPSSSGSGGGGGAKVWTITGHLRVRESEIDGDSHDRPLKGIEVKVSASDLGADGPWTEWGTVRADADGDFALSETNNGRTRFFRVQAPALSAPISPSRTARSTTSSHSTCWTGTGATLKSTAV